MPKTRRIHFEDKHQDFLWWDIDEKNMVVDCGPFQGWLWNGLEVHPSTIKIGEYPLTRKGEEKEGKTLRYKIIKIEEPK